jgi:uncharacterized phage protein gp47/JayE
MPWHTPTLRKVREQTRDNVTAFLSGAVVLGNNVLRVVSDCMAGLAHLVLRYIDWLALQLLPDTAETEWLDRHGQIWLTNADGSIGRKGPTLAQGTVTLTGTNGTYVPKGSLLSNRRVEYETIEFIVIGDDPTEVKIRAVEGGTIGNMLPSDPIVLISSVEGADRDATVLSLDGGTDEETDDELRMRVLLRIREPPMGGDKTDYVEWALAFPGVTRAWSFPNEMGIGTVTVRFMMDDLRASDDGFPKLVDIEQVRRYLDTVRPVAIKDFFVEAPIPYLINMTIYGLDEDSERTRAAIEDAMRKQFLDKAEPGVAWFRAWSEEATNSAPGVNSFDLTLEGNDDIRHINMPAPGYMPALGTITYLAG